MRPECDFSGGVRGKYYAHWVLREGSDVRTSREIRIEGYTPDELLAALDETTEALLFSGESVVFRAGSATILGQFGIEEGRLVLELAQIG